MDSVSFSHMNVIDILILVVFLINIIIGFGRGFVSEVLSLIVLIAAFVVAIMFTGQLSHYFSTTSVMHNIVSNANTEVTQPAEYMLLAVSFGILFISTLIIGGVIKLLINMLAAAGGLGFVNRILGLIFGFIRAYLIVLVLVFLVQLSPFAANEKWKQSVLVPSFQSQAIWLGNVVSPALAKFKDTFNNTVSEDTSEKSPSTEKSTDKINP